VKLLTDQRTPEKRAADALVAAFHKAFPTIAEHWGDITALKNAPIYKGGLVENLTQAMGYPERGEFIVPLRSTRLSRLVTKDGTLCYRVERIMPDEILIQTIPGDDEIDATLRSKPEIIADLQKRLEENMTKAFFGGSLGETYDPDKYRKD